jgi:hypothetical protein
VKKYEDGNYGIECKYGKKRDKTRIFWHTTKPEMMAHLARLKRTSTFSDFREITRKRV